jgi:hypothetical protein
MPPVVAVDVVLRVETGTHGVEVVLADGLVRGDVSELSRL